MELWMHFAVGHNYIASSVSIQNINGWKIIVKSSLFRKQKKQEEEEKERKKEERLRKREQKQKEREERRNLKKVKRQQEEEQKKLQMKIAMEERRLLLAQRNLESIRLIDRRAADQSQGMAQIRLELKIYKIRWHWRHQNRLHLVWLGRSATLESGLPGQVAW